MSITFAQLQDRIPWTKPVEAEWHQHPNGGGWVQNTATAHKTAYIGGGALVYGDAQVCGGAQVYGDAQVYGNARVYGTAWVYGDARVSGDAQVYGGAWEFSPLQVQGTRHFITTCSYTHIQIGCRASSVQEWLANYEKIGSAEGYSPDEVAEYGLILTLAAGWLKQKFEK